MGKKRSFEFGPTSKTSEPTKRFQQLGRVDVKAEPEQFVISSSSSAEDPSGPSNKKPGKTFPEDPDENDQNDGGGRGVTFQ